MNKLLYAVPAAAILIATNVLTPQPAFALPTCEQEISIRCHGYNVQGRGRLDIYYDSYEECIAAETPAQCGTDPSLGSLQDGAKNLADRTARTLVLKA